MLLDQVLLPTNGSCMDGLVCQFRFRGRRRRMIRARPQLPDTNCWRKAGKLQKHAGNTTHSFFRACGVCEALLVARLIWRSRLSLNARTH